MGPHTSWGLDGFERTHRSSDNVTEVPEWIKVFVGRCEPFLYDRLNPAQEQGFTTAAMGMWLPQPCAGTVLGRPSASQTGRHAPATAQWRAPRPRAFCLDRSKRGW